MKKAWQWLLLAAAMTGLAAPVAAREPAKAAGADKAAPVIAIIENAGYTFCVNEAIDAMAIGRAAMLFKRSREQIEADPQLPSYMRSLVASFFTALDAGQAPTYGHFAVRRFKQCLVSQQVPLQAGNDQLLACITRVDIPYFFFLLNQSGESQASAVDKLNKALAGWYYPEGLVQVLGEASYRARSLEEVVPLQVFMVNGCLFPAKEVSNYYGFTPPGPDSERPTGQAAPAAPGAAPGPAPAPAP